MRKFSANFVLTDNVSLTPDFSLMSFKLAGVLDPQSNQFVSKYNGKINVVPGQFVEIQVPDAQNTFLRRPISVFDWDEKNGILMLLVRAVGEGTKILCSLQPGARLNMVFPLGNGFGIEDCGNSPLLIGGGVGVAPLFYLGRKLKQCGVKPTFLLAARSKDLLLCIEAFSALGDVYISTDDGSAGERGVVTENSILTSGCWTKWFVCGPMPMMKAVSKVAASQNINCEVSLENTMACGVGACLCCVENTKEGHKCVCTDGPVFNTRDLLW